MKNVRGDLLALALEGHFDVIVHGCNCQCRMARGIAASIKAQFPEAEASDSQTTAGDPAKLGTFTRAEIERSGRRFTILNGYTQWHWSGDGVLADYSAIRQLMRAIKRDFSGQRIGYPKIGAGLAGGDWNIISEILREELAGENHTCVEYAAPAQPEKESGEKR